MMEPHKSNRVTVLVKIVVLLVMCFFMTAGHSLRSKPEILIIGDSISLGYMPFVQEELATLAEVSHNPGNAQHTGTGLKNIADWIEDGDWDIIQFNWGLWDLCYRHPDSAVQGNRDKVRGTITYSVEQYAAQLDSIVSILKTSDAQLVFVTTSYVPEEEAGRHLEDAIRYNEAAQEVMKKQNVLVHDIYAASKAIHQEWGKGRDDVHYTVEGYARLGKRIAAFLRDQLAQAGKIERPKPTAAQLAWQEAELGAVFHYDLHVFDQKPYRQGGVDGNRTNPISNHQMFNPPRLDTDQWIRAVKDAGFKFAILTATHETGFALYPSEVNPYSVKSLQWQDGKGDVVRDFVHSCRKYGIKPGIYLGIRWNSFFGVHDFVVNGEGDFRKKRQAYYNQMVEGMVTEICTNYGELFEIWFDGGASHPALGAPDVLPIVKKLQPNCLFYHNNQLAEARWGGSESGTVPYPCWATFPTPYSHSGDTKPDHLTLLKHGDPAGPYWMPAMSDAPLRGFNGRHEWFWEPDDEDHIFPLDHLMDMYLGSVGRNSTLIVGLTPDPEGLLPAPDVQRLKEWGAEIDRRFGTPLASTQGVGEELFLDLKQPTLVRDIVLQEEISAGERVRAYAVHAQWEGQWQEIARGTCIGHKRIQEVEHITTSKLKLVIEHSMAVPRIKNFSAF
ncbi:MAG: alpha-L-fucosidase [Saprospiraceae bacterium]|nr:alpha-L-fucosidase [Saprospiraceae bacterium]